MILILFQEFFREKDSSSKVPRSLFFQWTLFSLTSLPRIRSAFFLYCWFSLSLSLLISPSLNVFNFIHDLTFIPLCLVTVCFSPLTFPFLETKFFHPQEKKNQRKAILLDTLRRRVSLGIFRDMVFNHSWKRRFCFVASEFDTSFKRSLSWTTKRNGCCPSFSFWSNDMICLETKQQLQLECCSTRVSSF